VNPIRLAEDHIKSAHDIYLALVQEAIEKHGSDYALAKHLGIPRSTIRSAIDRDNLVALQKLAARIKDKSSK
jgi:hypothetical protein